MTKDMYQKRRERKLTEEEKSFSKVGINWDISAYCKLPSNSYSIRIV